MSRVCLSVVVMLALLASVFVQPANASALDPATVKAALRTATPEEDRFVDKVLMRVDQGTLPLELVETTFLWAQKKPRHKFQYFKAGLIVRAKDAGIKM